MTGDNKLRKAFLFSCCWLAAAVGSTSSPSGSTTIVSSAVSPRSQSRFASIELGLTVEAAWLALTSAVTAPVVGFGILTPRGVRVPSGVAVSDGAADADGMRWTSRSAVKISSSVNKEKGSRLLRIVPVKRVGSGKGQQKLVLLSIILTLWYHDDILPQILQSNQADVNLIHYDLAFFGLEGAEQSQGQ